MLSPVSRHSNSKAGSDTYHNAMLNPQIAFISKQTALDRVRKYPYEVPNFSRKDARFEAYADTLTLFDALADDRAVQVRQWLADEDRDHNQRNHEQCVRHSVGKEWRVGVVKVQEECHDAV